jgi:hypothetical protein
VSDSAPASRLARSEPATRLLEAALVAATLVLLVGLQSRSAASGLDLLTGDGGARLTLADLSLAGRRLYGEIAWLYGPLTFLPAALMARLTRDAEVAIFLVDLTAITVASSLLYLGLRRVLGRPGALAVGPGIVLPTVVATSLGAVYQGWIWLWNAALALLWMPPSDRPIGRSFAAGVALGALQMTKFGSPVAAFGAWACLELQAWDRRAVLRGFAAMMAGYVAAFAPFALWLVSRVPREIASDTLWPAWVLTAYARHTEAAWGFADFWSHVGAGYLVGVLLPQLIFLVAALVAVSPWSQSLFGGDRLRASLAFLPLFYVFSTLTVLKHVFHHLQYSTLLFAGAGLLALIRPDKLRGLAKALLLFVALIQWRPFLTRGTSLPTKPLVTPSGESLLLTEPDKERYEALFDLFAGGPAGQVSVLGVAESPGLYHFLEAHPPSRHFWFSPNVVRPYEAEAVRAQVESAPLLFVLPVESPGDPETAVRLLSRAGFPDAASLLEAYCLQGTPRGFMLYLPRASQSCASATRLPAL